MKIRPSPPPPPAGAPSSSKIRALDLEPAVDKGIAVQSVEVNRIVDASQLDQLLQGLGLGDTPPETRTVCYIETPGHDLLKSNLCLRVRILDRKRTELTLKLRPADFAALPASLGKLSDTKAEIDRNGPKAMPSFSVNGQADTAGVKKVLASGSGFKGLLDKDLKTFLETLGVELPQGLKTTPMAQCSVWKTGKGMPPTTVERWTLPSGEQLVCVSMKGAPAQAEELVGQLDEELKKDGVRLSADQTSKTMFLINAMDTRAASKA